MAISPKVLPELVKLVGGLNIGPEIFLRLIAVTLWQIEDMRPDDKWHGNVAVKDGYMVFSGRLQSAECEKRELPVKLKAAFTPGAVQVNNQNGVCEVEVAVTEVLATGPNRLIDNGDEFWRLVSESLQYMLALVVQLRQEKRELTDEILITNQGVIALVDEIVSQLTAGMAHEINNPLAFIRVNAEYIRRAMSWANEGAEWRGEVTEAVDAVIRGVERIAGVVEALKYFSRQGQGEKESFILAECVSEAWLLLSAGKTGEGGADFQMVIPTDLTVYGNRQQIEQVFVNLLSNAVKAIARLGKSGGRIAVQAMPNCGPEHGVVIEVRDNGGGIASENLKHIFTPFFTTDRSHGVGIGLSIVKGIIAEHGGSIVPAVADGQTTFRIRLPAG